MPKLEDPAVSAKQAMVAVAWPGASAHEMELKVAQLVEDELQSLPDIKKVKTECSNSQAMFTVEFQMTVLEKDLRAAFRPFAAKSKRPRSTFATRLLLACSH